MNGSHSIASFRGGTAPVPSPSRHSRYRARHGGVQASEKTGGRHPKTGLSGLAGLHLGGVGTGAHGFGLDNNHGGDASVVADRSLQTGSDHPGLKAAAPGTRSQPAFGHSPPTRAAGGASRAGARHAAVMRRLGSDQRRGMATGGPMLAQGTAFGAGAGSSGGASAQASGVSGSPPDKPSPSASKKAGRRRRFGSARPARSTPQKDRHLAPIPRIASAHFKRAVPSGGGDGPPSPTRRERMARLLEPSGSSASSHPSRPPSRQKNAFPTHLSEFDTNEPKSAFTHEAPRQSTATKERLNRRHGEESPRPPSRHKPPPQALFLNTDTTSPQPPSPQLTGLSTKPHKQAKGAGKATTKQPPGSDSKPRTSSSGRHAAWAIPTSRDSDGDSDGFGSMPVTYDIPIAVSGASPDARVLAAELDGSPPSVRDDGPVPQAPASWLRRTTGTAPMPHKAPSHGPAFLLEEPLDGFEPRTPRSARLSSLETADAELRRWEHQLARRYHDGPSPGAAPSGGGATTPGNLVLTDAGSDAGSGVGGPDRSPSLPSPVVSSFTTSRAPWSVAERGHSSSPPIAGVAINPSVKAARTRPRSGRARRRSTDSLQPPPAASRSRVERSRGAFATHQREGATTVVVGGGGKDAAARSHGPRPKSSRRLTRNRSARLVVNAPHSGAAAAGLTSPIDASHGSAAPREGRRNSHSSRHDKPGVGAGGGAARSTYEWRGVGGPPKAGRRSQRKLEATYAAPPSDGHDFDDGVGGSGDRLDLSGGRRNYGHGPPATPLVPFNSKLSQDFLDLFAHSVPSPRKP